MSPDNTSQVEQVADFIRAASRLRKEIIGRNATKKFLAEQKAKDQESFVLYAIDTGAVKAYCDPFTTGPLADDGQHGAGHIFPGDRADQGAQIIFADALSDFIFKRLHDQGYLFQLPGHARETQSVYAAVARNYEKTNRHRQTLERRANELKRFELQTISNLAASDNLSAMFHKLIEADSKNGENSGDANKLISRFIFAFYEDYFQKGDAQRRRWKKTASDGRKKQRNPALLEYEYLNFLSLMVNPGLIPVEQASDNFNRPGFEGLAWALAAGDLEKQTFDEVVRFNQLSKLWKRRLAFVKSSLNTSGFNVDAEALATLDLINQRLEKLDNKPRMILITNDRSMIEACSRKFPQAERPQDGFSHTYFENLAEKYLRHSHAYIVESLFGQKNARERDQEVDLITWLDGFLSKISGLTKFTPKNLVQLAYDERDAEKLAQDFLDSSAVDAQTFQELSSEWREIRKTASESAAYTSRLMGNEEMRSTVESTLAKLQANKNTQIERKSLGKLVDELAQGHNRDQWQKFVIDLTEAGANLLLESDDLNGRNPPDVRLDALPRTDVIFQRLISGYYNGNSKKFTRDLNGVKEDTVDDFATNNGLGYIHYLILSALFARNGKWWVTYSMALRAIDIIEQAKKSSSAIKAKDGSFFSGREAYFVAAMSLRLVAKKAFELDQTQYFLKKAEAALEEDHNHGTAGDQNGARFSLGRLGLELSRYYFHRQEGEDKEAQQTRQAIHNEYRNFIDHYWQKEKVTRVSTQINAVTNFIQICVIETYQEKQSKPLDHWKDMNWQGLLTECLEILNGHSKIASKSGMQPAGFSYVIKSYLIAGKMLLGDKSITAAKVNQHFSDGENGEISKHKIADYDEWRYTKLREFCLDTDFIGRYSNN